MPTVGTVEYSTVIATIAAVPITPRTMTQLVVLSFLILSTLRRLARRGQPDPAEMVLLSVKILIIERAADTVTSSDCGTDWPPSRSAGTAPTSRVAQARRRGVRGSRLRAGSPRRVSSRSRFPQSHRPRSSNRCCQPRPTASTPPSAPATQPHRSHRLSPFSGRILPHPPRQPPRQLREDHAPAEVCRVDQL